MNHNASETTRTKPGKTQLLNPASAFNSTTRPARAEFPLRDKLPQGPPQVAAVVVAGPHGSDGRT